MNRTDHLWTPVLIGVAGLIAGYTVVLTKGGTDAFSQQYHCQMQQEVCDGQDCDHAV